jgi:hypothetical protein
LPPHAGELWEAAGNGKVLKDLHVNTAQLAINVEAPALGHAVYRVQAHSQANTMDAAHAAASAAPRATAAAAAAAAAAASNAQPVAATGSANDSTSHTRSISNIIKVGNQGGVTLSNGVLEVTVDSSGIKVVKMLTTGQSHQYSSALVQYKSNAGPSGAYLFAAGRDSEVSSHSSKHTNNSTTKYLTPTQGHQVLRSLAGLNSFT